MATKSKVLIIAALVTIFSLSAYSKNYEKRVIGMWQSTQIKIIKVNFMSGGRLIYYFGKMKIKGKWKIEEDYLITRYYNKKETNILRIINITQSVLHIIIYTQKKNRTLKKHDFYIRVK